jgi:type IX secretion system PorP/SprF family membrane protein
MRKLLPIVLILLYASKSNGQNTPAFRQFNFNPFLFNSAYAGSNGYTEVYLVHRQQWLNFNDAPVTSGFNLQYPTQKKVSLGFNFVTQEVVALRNSTAMGTFAYHVPITGNQSIRFGISAGIGINNLSLEEGEDYSDDEAILSAAANPSYFDGNFGVLYTLHGLQIGFALPRIFGQKNISPQEFDGSRLSQLKNQFYSIRYKFNLGSENISLAPYMLYRKNRDGEDSWEIASTIYFKEKIWTGVSYHNTNGIAFTVGANIKDRILFGYSYEIPLSKSDFISTSSHEFHLGIRFGKKKENKVITKSNTTQSTLIAKEVKSDSIPAKDTETEIPIENNPIVEEVNTVVNSVKVESSAPVPTPTVVNKDNEGNERSKEIEKVVNEPLKGAPQQNKLPLQNKKPPQNFSLAKGHYLVIGAFKVMENATHYLMTLKKKGFDEVSLAINPKNNLYYVYIFSSYDIEETRKARNQYRMRKPFGEAWIFSMD